jgi:phosphoribosylanthranilate isomerase
MSKFIVTVTGADDNVMPDDLIKLSKKYEFVEWGILFSATQSGTKRYPTKEWRNALYAATLESAIPINLSAHLCGQFVDQRLYSRDYLTTEVEIFYRRVQFNKFNEDNSKYVLDYAENNSTPTIFPCNKKTREIIEKIEDKSRLSVLFDSSGGNGIAPKEWPDHMKGTFLCGYAGGIDETNVADTITRLGVRYLDKPFWIDLETGARDENNEFDVNKVERILEKASAYYGENRIQLI